MAVVVRLWPVIMEVRVKSQDSPYGIVMDSVAEGQVSSQYFSFLLLLFHHYFILIQLSPVLCNLSHWHHQ